ncbi:unnamed protein product [Clavelina lepadiformis]|uniref:Uncharacterized protein n=1 Tax=Clavelina lepadiformis TaxID=159417 RepID=A0ABP0FUZ7_CLALP
MNLIKCVAQKSVNLYILSTYFFELRGPNYDDLVMSPKYLRKDLQATFCSPHQPAKDQRVDQKPDGTITSLACPRLGIPFAELTDVAKDRELFLELQQLLLQRPS